MKECINCYICGEPNLTRDVVGLNKKLISRNLRKFHCITCLADYLEISVEDLEERIEYFKDSGCALFG